MPHLCLFRSRWLRMEMCFVWIKGQAESTPVSKHEGFRSHAFGETRATIHKIIVGSLISLRMLLHPRVAGVTNGLTRYIVG